MISKNMMWIYLLLGSDWEGKFDYLNEYCQVVYLPRTEGISSTMLREDLQDEIKVGIIDTGRIAERFVPESQVVNYVEVSSVYDIDQDKALDFAMYTAST